MEKVCTEKWIYVLCKIGCNVVGLTISLLFWSQLEVLKHKEFRSISDEINSIFYAFFFVFDQSKKFQFAQKQNENFNAIPLH